jgi:hypothetical protein
VRRELAGALAAVVAGLTGCGDDAPATTDDGGGTITCTEPLATRYLPLAIGATWTYDVSEPDTPARQKSNTVEALEDVGDRKVGVVGFRIRTEKLDGYTVSWQEDRCTSIIRHREQSFDAAGTLASDQFYVPGKLRVDETPEHLTLGARWSISYTEVEIDPVAGVKTVSKDETWSVEAVDEAVTVPAGTFTTLRVRKVTSGAADKTFWFARGVGKIMEQGEQREELRAYTLP